MTPIGEQIRAARVGAGLSIEEVARRLDVTPGYVRDIERKGRPAQKTAQRMARLYDCHLNLFYMIHGARREQDGGTATP